MFLQFLLLPIVVNAWSDYQSYNSYDPPTQKCDDPAKYYKPWISRNGKRTLQTNR